MKSSPDSPVEFLEPLSRYPERVYAVGISTPFGPMALAGEGNALIAARLNVPFDPFIHELRVRWGATVIEDRAPFTDLIHRLDDYFSGKPESVRAVVRPLPATPFVHAAHRVMASIPYGETITYTELGELIGNPKAVRAAGSACGKNPVIIVIPCHRVIASKGLGGFGAGLDVKRRLLALESGQ